MIFEIVLAVIISSIITKEVIYYMISHKLGICPHCGNCIETGNEYKARESIGFKLK